MKRKKKKRIDLYRHRKDWTRKEENLLRKLYPNYFTYELVERFGRTNVSLVYKASQLGIRKNWRKYDPNLPYRYRLWTQKEIEKLEKLYPVTPTKKLLSLFPKRSRVTIIRKANSLDLKKVYLNSRTHSADADNTLNLWRKEKELLAKLYPTMSNKELAQKFGRTKAAIAGTAWKLGLHKANHVPGNGRGQDHKLWSKEEDALLKKLYPTRWTKDLVEQLGRSTASVRKRALTLGLRKDPKKFTPPPRPNIWPDKDIKKLRQLWGKGVKISEIAKAVDRTQRSTTYQIGRQKREFGLQHRCEPSKSWSPKEEAYLIRNYTKKSIKQISEKLGRTKYAIRCRAVIFKISTPNLNRWTKKDIDKLRKLWQKGFTAKQITKIIGKTIFSIRYQVQRQKQDFGMSEEHNPHRWSKEQTAYLIKHYHKKTAKEMTDILGRTPESILAKARKIKLSASAPKSWTQEEVGFLIKHYPRWTASKIAKTIGKTTSSVQTKARRLKLSK